MLFKKKLRQLGTRTQASKLLANLHFWPLGLIKVPWLLYSLFATALICAALGILCWSICKWDVTSVFFNLRVVSKSLAEICTPVWAVLELRFRTNLPCLVKLALIF